MRHSIRNKTPVKYSKTQKNNQNVIQHLGVTNHSEKPQFLELLLDEILYFMQESFQMETFFFCGCHEAAVHVTRRLFRRVM